MKTWKRGRDVSTGDELTEDEGRVGPHGEVGHEEPLDDVGGQRSERGPPGVV